ncbi:MAG: PEGA domain-containing protein [Myxococcaceae bacterium]
MLLTALAVVLAANEPAPPPGLAVMDFAVEGVAPEVGSAVSGLVSHELERLQLFRVNSAETTRVILGVERQRQLLGCDNCSATNLGELTSFEYIVTGKLIRSGTAKDSTYNLLLTLLKVGQPSPLSSVKLTAKGEEKLLQDVPPSTIKLVGKLLEGRQGSLVVSSSETGAAVKIDDTQVGTTPLQARVNVAAGPHLLTIEKDGFTQVKKEVRINADQVSDEFVRLVPSPDMAEQYEAKAGRLRAIAWTSAGVGAAGLAVFILGSVVSSNTYGSPGAEGTFEWHRKFLVAGEETSLPGTEGCPTGKSDSLCNHRAAAGQLKASIESWQAVSYIGLGAAGVGAAAATILFIVGDPPGKYEAYRQKTGVVSMQVTPTLGGVLVQGQF